MSGYIDTFPFQFWFFHFSAEEGETKKNYKAHITHLVVKQALEWSSASFQFINKNCQSVQFFITPLQYDYSKGKQNLLS